MATKISEYSATPASNTDLDGINLSENVMVPSDVNDALRMQMAHLKDLDTGASALTSPEFASATMTGDLNFGDGDKAIFGAGSDLQVFHSGTHSWINENGTGNLYIQSSGAAVNITNGSTRNLAQFNTTAGTVTLYHDNGTSSSAKLATTASGINVTGSVVSDGLSVDGDSLEVTFSGSTSSTLHIAGDTANSGDSLEEDAVLKLSTDNGAFHHRLSALNGAAQAPLQFTHYGSGTDNKTLLIGYDGDITFFDNTGVTQGFRWDASTQRLGLGTTAPAALMHLKQTTGNAILRINSDSGERRIDFGDATDDDGGRIKYDGSDNLQFYTSGTEKVRINSSGLVGIGTQSPARKFHIQTADNIIGLIESTDADAWLAFKDNTSSTDNAVRIGATGDNLRFYAGSAERMHIESSGNVGIGTTPDRRLQVKSDENNAANTTIGLAPSTTENVQGGLGVGSGGILGVNAVNTIQFRLGGADGDGAIEVARIDSGGRVGIGTTATSGAKLKVDGGATAGTIIQAGNAQGGVILGAESSTAYVNTTSSTPLAFEINNSEKMRIDSSGNLLHQRTSNTISGTSVNKMTLGNGTGQYGAIIDVGSGSGYYGFAKNGAYNSRIRYNYATNSMAFDVNNSEAMRLDSGGKLNVNNVTGSGRVNISADNWPENALALYSAGIAGQANFAGMGFFNQDADSPIGQTADIYTNPTGTLSLTASGNPAIQLKYGSAGISGGTPALTVDNAGRVGIGSTSPNTTTKLDVNGPARFGNSTDGIIIENSTNSYGIGNASYIRRDQGSGHLELVAGSTVARNMLFKTKANGGESARITSFGDVGIGRTDPQNIVGNHGGGLVIKSAAGRAGTTTLFAVQDSSGNTMFSQLHNGQATVKGEGSATTSVQQGLAKAWINYNGDNTGSIRDSFNCGSMTDNGNGNHTVNYTNNMANTGYAVMTQSQSGDGANPAVAVPDTQSTNATGSTRVSTWQDGGSSFDSEYTGLTTHGDLA